MKISIRTSVPNDVNGIRQVQRKTWLTTYPNAAAGITRVDIEGKFKDDATPEGKQRIEERKIGYQDHNKQTWVAEDQDKIVGFCIAAKEGDHYRLMAIYVLPEYHDLGLGRKLITAALLWLGDDKDILLNVATYNQRAINFYKKFGFIATGQGGTLDAAAQLPSGKTIPEIEMKKSALGKR